MHGTGSCIGRLGHRAAVRPQNDESRGQPGFASQLRTSTRRRSVRRTGRTGIGSRHIKKKIGWALTVAGLASIAVGVGWAATVWSDDAARMDATLPLTGLIIGGIVVLVFGLGLLGALKLFKWFDL